MQGSPSRHRNNFVRARRRRGPGADHALQEQSEGALAGSMKRFRICRGFDLRQEHHSVVRWLLHRERNVCLRHRLQFRFERFFTSRRPFELGNKPLKSLACHCCQKGRLVGEVMVRRRVTHARSPRHLAKG